eukprot:357001-Chlamydomonas_euryale.AAC.16
MHRPISRCASTRDYCCPLHKTCTHPHWQWSSMKLSLSCWVSTPSMQPLLGFNPGAWSLHAGHIAASKVSASGERSRRNSSKMEKLSDWL